MQAVVDDFIMAPSWLDSRLVLEAHPELLSQPADALLTQLAQAQDDEMLRDFIEDLQSVLQACRKMGVDTVFSILTTSRDDDVSELLASGDDTVGAGISKEKIAWAAQQNELADSLCDDPLGDRVDNLERAIGCYQAALKVFTREALPVLWAWTQGHLGMAYENRVLGDRADNLETAIDCYRAALCVLTRTARPTDWALTQNNLGSVYTRRIRGYPADNLELAIDCYQAVLQVYTRETSPTDWAMVQHNLGLAYRQRVRGDRADNVERAIACLEDVQQIYTRETLPTKWATTQNSLGGAYTLRVRGDRADNLEAAISCYQAALQEFTLEARPVDWASAQNNLGLAYVERIRGDRAENLEAAIGYYRSALRVRTREMSPTDWAETQDNLGYAYEDRIRGDRADNLEAAIDCHQAALQVHTRETLPAHWAKTQSNLGSTYASRIRGDRADNLEAAIDCHQAALQVHTREAFPVDWAGTHLNLGNAYAQRIRGDRTDNREAAIDCFRMALQVFTPESRPVDWGLAQHNLGTAYMDRVQGNRADNLEAAVDCYHAALQARTREALPVDWASTQRALGNAYRERVRRETGDLEEAIACYDAALQVYTPEALPSEWAMTQNGLGSAYSHRDRGDRADNLEAAIDCYRGALQVRAQDVSPTDRAMIQYNLGLAYAERLRGDPADNLAQAITCMQSALQVYQSDTRPHESRHIASSLGGACSQVGRWREAAEAYRIALEATELCYQASLLASSRQAELAESGHLPVRAVYALAQAGEVREAVVVLERARARELGDGLDRDRADLAEVARCDPEGYESYRRAAELVRKLNTSEQRSGLAGEEITASAGVAWEGDQRAQRLAQEKLADETRAAIAELAAAVERIRRVPGFESFLAQPDLDKIAPAVEASTPLAYLVCAPAGSLTLIVRQTEESGLAIEVIWAEDFSVTDLIAFMIVIDGDEVTGGYIPGQLGLQIAGKNGGELDRQAWLEDALTEGLPLLADKLLGPLAARLTELGATGVVLVPCGFVGLLPLHAAGYRRGERRLCLLDEFDVSYAPSARVLTTARSILRAKDGLLPVLAGVGNPLPHPAPLGFARAELEEVAACFEEARPLYEEAATKEALLDAAVGATYVHLSCHGMYEPAEPLSSQLQLANQQPLSLAEILADRPFADARLVVASACQTAITDFARVPDEAIGLPAGFLSAGTPGVIGTLWPVNDLSTALLMAQFYRYHLRGDPTTKEQAMSPVRALRHAQRWLATVSAGELYERFVADARVPAVLPQAAAAPGSLVTMATAHYGLDDPDTRPFASPYHWAPFIFVGA